MMITNKRENTSIYSRALYWIISITEISVYQQDENAKSFKLYTFYPLVFTLVTLVT